MECLIPPSAIQRYSTEFLIGQHSLFLAALLGKDFSMCTNLHPVAAGRVGMAFVDNFTWGIVFILFYHERPAFSRAGHSPLVVARVLRDGAELTLIAEAIWILGFMPPPARSSHRRRRASCRC